jgi:hypothetical protein
MHLLIPRNFTVIWMVKLWNSELLVHSWRSTVKFGFALFHDWHSLWNPPWTTFHSEFHELHSEFHELHSEFHEFHSEFHELHSGFHSEFDFVQRLYRFSDWNFDEIPSFNPFCAANSRQSVYWKVNWRSGRLLQKHWSSRLLSRP